MSDCNWRSKHSRKSGSAPRRVELLNPAEAPGPPVPAAVAYSKVANDIGRWAEIAVVVEIGNEVLDDRLDGRVAIKKAQLLVRWSCNDWGLDSMSCMASSLRSPSSLNDARLRLGPLVV